MKTNEFRTGNYIKSGKGIYKIFALSSAQILAIQDVGEPDESQEKVYSSDNTIIKPIPMTGYWLYRFGFRQDQEDSCRWYLLEGSIVYDLDDNTIRISDSWEWAHINYVNQLQNIYYALTGKELAEAH